MSPSTLFIPPILIATGALLFGAWRVFVRRSKSTIDATLLAVGCGAATLVLGVYVMYTWSAYNLFRVTWWPGYIALAVFCFVFIAHAAKNAPKTGVIALGLMLGLVMLCVCGLVLWIIVACGIGDCI